MFYFISISISVKMYTFLPVGLGGLGRLGRRPAVSDEGNSHGQEAKWRKDKKY